jgi:glycosyltransferase involved in cell wall biosynthesis
VSGPGPLVSVFLPTYNQAAFIESAVLSAVEQDYADLEVVVGDDGSTDGTAELVLDLARRFPGRVLPLVGLGHVGIAANCNRILRACRGSYVAFHAGDDLWLPGKLGPQVAWLEADPRRVLCSHDVEVFDSTTGARMHLWSEVTPLSAGAGVDGFIRDGNPFHPIGNVVRASAIPRGGFDDRILLASDWKFFVECVAGGGQFGFVDGVWARYRKWPGNVTKREEQMLDDLLLTLDLLEAEFPEARSACRRRRETLLYAHGRALLGRGRQAEARATFRRALAAEPSSTRVRAALLLRALPAPLVGGAQRAVHAARAALGSGRRS